MRRLDGLYYKLKDPVVIQRAKNIGAFGAFLIILFSLALNGSFPLKAHANSCTSLAGSRSWSQSSSWSGCGGVTPQPADTVTIAPSSTMSLDIDATVANITLVGIFNGTSHNLTLDGSSGTLMSGAGTFNAGTGTITFAASANGLFATSKAYTFYNLTINASASNYYVSPGGTTTINNNFTFTKGFFWDSGQQVVGNATGTLSMASGTILYLGTATATVFPTNFTSAHISLSAGSTIQYRANSAQTISNTPTYATLQIQPYAQASNFTDTIAGAITVNGDLTVNPTASSAFTLTVNLGGTTTVSGTTTITGTTSGSSNLSTTGSNYALTTGALNIANGGGGSSALTANASTITDSGNWTDPNNKFVKGTSTVKLTGNGTISSSAGASFYSLWLGYSGNTTTIGTQALQISGGLVFNGGTVTTTSSSYSYLADRCTTTCTDITFNSPTALTYSGTATVFSIYNITDAGSITVTIPGANYGSWSLNYWDNAFTGVTFNLGGDITTTGNMALENSAASQSNSFNTQNHSITAGNFQLGNESRNQKWSAINLGSSTLTLSGQFGVVGTGGDQIIDLGSSNISVAGAVLFGFGTGTLTVTPGTSTLTMNPATSSGFYPYGQTLYNFVASPGATITLYDTFSVSNNLSITSGTLNDSGYQITGNGTGSFTMSSGTTLKLGTTSAATLFPTGFTSGHTTLDAASTIIYNATVDQTISGTPAYGNLQLSAASGTPTKTLSAAATVTGNLTIDASNTLDTSTGNNYAISLAGNYTNNGTFTARSGTVTLNGSSQQTLSGTMTSGSAFYNLAVTNSSGANASDCELTGFTASVVFGASVTSTNNLTFTTASSRIQYTSGSTYTFTNINWNGQASGTKIYFRNSAASGSWILNVSGAQTAVSWINVSRSDASGGSAILANDGTNTDCSNNTNWTFGAGNTAPNSPSSLVQKHYTGGATMSIGDWTNETSATFTASASDPDNPDTEYLCVEVVPIASSFTNTETGCGSGVAYAGTPVTVTYSNTTLSDATEYKWQARVKDAAGAYSAWVDYGSNGASRDFGVDTTAPTTGTVYDGTTTSVESSYNDGSLTSISANWSGWNANVSGINFYEYSVGTTSGGTSLVNWTSNGTATSVTASSLNLRTNQPYYFNVRATDNAGNVSGIVSSTGQYVLPQLTFSISSSSLTFSNLNASNNLQDSKTTTLTTSTNAYGGYVISAYAAGLLNDGTNTIPAYAAGSYASPASWGSGLCSGSSCGFGYTSSDTTISGSNKFGTGTLYAPFSLTAPGDIVADHTTAVNGTSGPVSNESFTITCKLAVSNLQPSTTYGGTIYYIATGTF